MKHVVFIFLFLSVTSIYAQTDSINVSAKIADSFTGNIIEDGKVELLAADSSFIGMGSWWYNNNNEVRTESFVMVRIAKGGEYLLRITHKDYVTTYYPFKIRIHKRHDTRIKLSGKILIRKKPKETMLGEAVVKATKIKMVMRGDTIVYNADAFQLSQGSMLDALIEQLPGAELKENGVITVNGKTISSLLVNGKDFFRGDPRIALENLPAYMVDKVKVYEQQTVFEKMTGLKDIVRPLVMDVNLKRQYSVGWIANAEAAYGTEDKYLGRIFAMRFTDCSRLAFFGGINNTNDTRRPGRRGDWTPSYLPDGTQTSKTAGAEYYYENRQKTFEWTSNLQATRTDSHIRTRTSSESFLPSDRAYTLSQNNWRNKTTNLYSSHRFEVRKDAFQMGSVNFSYDKNSNISMDRAGEFGSDPYAMVSGDVLDELFRPGADALREIARYRRSREVRSRGENWGINAPYMLSWSPFERSGIGDLVNLELSGRYDKHTSHTFDKYNLEYFNADNITEDYRNRYNHKSSLHYYYNAKLYYTIVASPPKNLTFTLSYGYSQDYKKGRSDLFRLDRLPDWGKDTPRPIGTLPSAASEMQQALDIQNSEHSNLWRRNHEMEMRMRYRFEQTNFPITIWLSLPVRIEQDHLVYNRSAGLFDLHRSKPLFTPNVHIQQTILKGNKATIIDLEYNLSRHQPGLVNTIELVNDANPLYIQKGNAALRTGTTHALSLNMDTRRNRLTLYNLALSYHRTRNAQATERTYNPATGGYTVRPVNVNGNWRTDGNLSLDRQFGKQKQFSWGSRTSYSFDHNVDMANVEGVTANGLSIIRNLYLSEQLTLGYSQNGWNIGAKVRGNFNRLTGKRSDFEDINAWDYNYGLTARIPLPWGIGLNTDFTVYSRRGYGDPKLNTDDLVWNLRLERSVLQGNLTFAVDGFDLLHNLSKVTRTVNAQGRTESYTNVLPAYFMAHIIYKFNKQPKKKKR